MKWTMAAALLLVGAACGNDNPTDSGDETPTKQSVATQISSGAADAAVDWCARYGWYDDGECDMFCEKADPDCATTPYQPCGGLSCGDTCQLCPPDDPDCIETAVVKYCQDNGGCHPAMPTCDGGEPEPEPYEPCGGLTCGDTCTICSPDDPDCIETAVVKYCQENGGCHPAMPTCDGGEPEPEPYEPCGGLTCGDTCTICSPDDPDCIETAVVKYCQEDGGCHPSMPTCDGGSEPYDPCDGLSCGDRCSVCPPDDPGCIETTVLKYCSADGACEPTQPLCSTSVYIPCAGLTCGDSCQLCDPADPTCVETAVQKFCHEDGRCQASFPVCSLPYDPCAGLACGDTCQLCDPADPNCLEPAVLRACDADGACVISSTYPPAVCQ